MFFPLGENQGDVPVRTASFAKEDRTLFWPKARLYPDRLVLTGWYFWGRYRRSISLDRVEQTEAGDREVSVHLASGAQIHFRVPDPDAWAGAILAYREVGEP